MMCETTALTPCYHASEPPPPLSTSQAPEGEEEEASSASVAETGELLLTLAELSKKRVAAALALSAALQEEQARGGPRRRTAVSPAELAAAEAWVRILKLQKQTAGRYSIYQTVSLQKRALTRVAHCLVTYRGQSVLGARRESHSGHLEHFERGDHDGGGDVFVQTMEICQRPHFLRLLLGEVGLDLSWGGAVVSRTVFDGLDALLDDLRRGGPVEYVLTD